MDNTQNSLTRIQEIITKGLSATIVLPNNPSADAISAATALYLGLVKMGKNITLACASKTATDMAAGDKIQTNLTSGGDNLVVSFPYTDGAIDKVDYNIQGNSFNLIVTPRQGYPKLNPEQVKYSYSGGIVNFIIVIDSPTLNNLGILYTDNQSQFTGKDIINIDRHLTNSFYGTVNFVNKTVSSISELILSILQGIQVEIDRDMATNLYAGIATATNNFTSYSVNADTFEHIAALLRLGAVKKLIKKPENRPINTFSNDFEDPSAYQPSSFQTPVYQPQQNNSIQSPPKVPQKQQPKINIQGKQGPELHSAKTIENVEKETNPDQIQSPQDWLKPKIFKGSGLI